MKNKVNILGTEYSICLDVPENEMPEESDGAMDQSMHKIMFAKIEPSRNCIRNLESYKNKVLRHEIIHAFLYESGLWNNSGNVQAWAQNEEITDWFAIQSPKIYKVFNELGIVE